MPADKAASTPSAAASSAHAAAAAIAENTEPPPGTKAERRAKARQEQKEKLARAKEAKALKAAAAKAMAQEKSKAPASVVATVSAAVAAPSPVPASAADKFLINVGLFVDANNARNAYAKLRDAGLPALSQEIKSAKGVRTRVRVGPYDSQSEADSAAETIRALHLDAAVVKPQAAGDRGP